MAQKILDLVQGEATSTSHDPTGRIKRMLHRELVSTIDLRSLEGPDDDKTRARLRATLDELARGHSLVLSQAQRDLLFEDILDEILGFGPLERLLKMHDVSDILVNGPRDVWVERRGRLERSSAAFRDSDHLLHVIRRIVSSVGRRIDEASPLVDARLHDGTRVNAVIPPITLDGPALSLRRFGQAPLQREDLVRNGSAPGVVLDLVEACVRGRLNVLVSGGTGSGKTTLLNVMSGFIPSSERIVTIEDAAELRLQQEHIVRMETRPANLEGRGEVTTRMLVKNALRMRPDRIVVGEIRGDEAIDMLQAMNTGHDGSMSTVHANSPAHAISRLKTMVSLTLGNLPDRAIAEILGDALQLVVHVRRGSDGVRRVMRVSEVGEFDGQDVPTHDIVRFRQTHVSEDGSVHGVFEGTGHVPSFGEVLRSRGIPFDDSIAEFRQEV